jgi:hypothetical protein
MGVAPVMDLLMGTVIGKAQAKPASKPADRSHGQ